MGGPLSGPEGVTRRQATCLSCACPSLPRVLRAAPRVRPLSPSSSARAGPPGRVGWERQAGEETLTGWRGGLATRGSAAPQRDLAAGLLPRRSRPSPNTGPEGPRGSLSPRRGRTARGRQRGPVPESNRLPVNSHLRGAQAPGGSGCPAPVSVGKRPKGTEGHRDFSEMTCVLAWINLQGHPKCNKVRQI